MKRRTSIFYMTLVVALVYSFFSYSAYSADRTVNEQGQYSFVIPAGFVSAKQDDSGSVELVNTTVLSTMVPKLFMNVLPEERALENYDAVMTALAKGRYSHSPRMKLLSKGSLLSSQGIRGWALTYLDHQNTVSQKNIPMIYCRYLLDHGEEKMIEIMGVAPYESRTDFIITSDNLVNSIKRLK